MPGPTTTHAFFAGPKVTDAAQVLAKLLLPPWERVLWKKQVGPLVSSFSRDMR